MTEAMGDHFLEAITKLKAMPRSQLRAVVITGGSLRHYAPFPQPPTVATIEWDGLCFGARRRMSSHP
jgi:hypothetical protein